MTTLMLTPLPLIATQSALARRATPYVHHCHQELNIGLDFLGPINGHEDFLVCRNALWRANSADLCQVSSYLLGLPRPPLEGIDFG